MTDSRSEAALDLKGLLFAAFLMGGEFKGDPRLSWVPVDLTLLLGGALALLVLWTVVRRNRFRFRPETAWVLALFSIFLVPVLWTDLHPYAVEKVSRFFTLTLLAAVAPLVLFRSLADVTRFINGLVLLGVVQGSDALTGLLQGASHARLSGFGANPIAFGRSVGLIFIWTALQGIEGRWNGLAALAGVGLSALLLIASGSRGPLFSAVGLICLAGIIYYRRRRPAARRFALAALVVALALPYGLASAPQQSGQRIEKLASGSLDTSELTRLDAYDQSLELIGAHPLGIGWGGFASQVDQSGNGGTDRQYPHNLLLEVLLEGGWLCGLALIGFCWLALRRIARQPASFQARALLLLYGFLLCNAMVSGDLNDNRLLFAFAAIGLRLGWDGDGDDPESSAYDLRPRLPGHAHFPQGMPDAGGGRL